MRNTRQPFQKGFLAAPWDGAGGQAATMATGKAASMLPASSAARSV